MDKKVPVFEINYKPKVQLIFRDLTEEAFQIIMDEIAENHRNILMLAAFGGFAGLRPSEACNVRRPDSVLGPGMRFEMRDGQIVNVIIDLREEKNLRNPHSPISQTTRKVYPWPDTLLMENMRCQS